MLCYCGAECQSGYIRVAPYAQPLPHGKGCMLCNIIARQKKLIVLRVKQACKGCCIAHFLQADHVGVQALGICG